MDTEPEEGYIYSCDVKTSSVIYPVDESSCRSTEEGTGNMWDDEPPAWELDEPAPAAAEGAAAEGAAGEAAAPEVPVILLKDRPKAPKPKYTLHWVRPLVLNYDYIYDYRKNYYDDVIDYLDSRQRGINRETPRAQEWAERVLRSYVDKIELKSHKRSADMRWIAKYKPTTRYYSYHTRAYYSLKYQAIL